MDDIRDKYNGGESQAREAFEELCAMAIALEVKLLWETCLDLYPVKSKPVANFLMKFLFCLGNVRSTGNEGTQIWFEN